MPRWVWIDSTLGRKTSDGEKMRGYSGDPDGGTSTDDVARAWDRGYSETVRQRDGHTWDDAVAELRDGRALMLQVWHATTGGPCLSGSGAYGHGLTVAPEQHSDGRWLVADPWCKPPSWVWWSASKLRDGAEEWAGRCAREVEGRDTGHLPDMRAYPLILIHEAARRLRNRWGPHHPAPAEPPLEAGGGGILYASGDAHSGGTDVSINANGSRLVSSRMLDCGDGLNFYADAELTDQLGELGHAQSLPYIGGANGSPPGLAVLYDTGTPYDDKEQRPTIVYVNPEHVGDPYSVEPEPEPAPPPTDDVAEAVAERDRAWREWMADDPEAPDRA